MSEGLQHPTRQHEDDESLHSVVDAFRHAWLSGRRPRIEDFVPDTALPKNETLFYKLVEVELLERMKLGDHPTLTEYVRRFPDYTDVLSGLDILSGDRSSMDMELHPEAVATVIEQRRLLDHFELLQVIGKGATGMIWKARDTKLDRNVAIKLPRKEELSIVETERFLREARAAAQLRHPNIVPIHEVGFTGQSVYLVCGFVAGINLQDWLKLHRPTAWEATELCAKLARAVEHAHENGIVHRDLKPANVLIDEHGEPQITDFGLARRENSERTLTGSGQVIGTPSYMPPEQAAGKPEETGPRSDVYSLGALFYELLTGKKPFDGGVPSVIHQVLHIEPARPRKLNKAIPRDLETICLKAMSKEQPRRYPSALEMALDLERALRGEPIKARPVGTIERTWRWSCRNPGWATAGMVSGMGIVSLLMMVLALFDQEPTPIAPDAPRTVTLTTEPVGAEVYFIPLSPTTGEPIPEKIVHAGKSPVKVDLKPSDYLVEAVLNDKHFHEVFRHVPGRDEALPYGYNNQFWKLRNGIIDVPPVKIPEKAPTEGMVLMTGGEFETGISGSETYPLRRVRATDFYIDTTEVSAGICKRARGGTLPADLRKNPPADNQAVYLRYAEALDCAEQLGKRLPSEIEWEYAATQGGTRSFPWGDGPPPFPEIPANVQPLPEFEEVGKPVLDILPTNPPLFGFYSNLAERTTSIPGVPPEIEKMGLVRRIPAIPRIIRGGDIDTFKGNPQITAASRNPRQRIARANADLQRGVGLRCVRSPHPRLKPEDFALTNPDRLTSTSPENHGR